jgi:hypothetical protein
MTMFRIRRLSLVATFASAIAWASIGLAEDPAKPNDDALDSLLEKLDARAKPPAEAAKPGDPKPSGEVDPKDKALDSLLEKLGQAVDKPSPDDHAKMPSGPGDQPPPDQPKDAKPGDEKPQDDKPAPDDLKGRDKDLDRHLEEVAGKRRKKKDQDGEGSGPLSEVIKEMREVEQRLGESKTGEETRKRQTEIVRNLEQLIEQMRNSQGQAHGKRQRKLARNPNQQPGQKPSSTPGTTGGGAPSTKPRIPTSKRSVAGGKDEWGHLPPELRQELDNVFKEEPLPSKEELIRRYYLSVSKKSLVREE